jgi:hypothetical protein
MPRQQKPPGMEKWTWPEIRAGRRMSKSEKRFRRLAKHMGATEKPDGNIQPPPAADNPGYYLFGGLLFLMFVMLGARGCAQ